MNSKIALAVLIGFATAGLAVADPNVAALFPPEQAAKATPERALAPKSDTVSPAVTADGMVLPRDGRNVAMAAVGTEEAEGVIVSATFDQAPPEYPALPEVAGTKINSGKKTSFVRPEQFPSVTNNDYREATATTPGIIVSEEPTSPIVNFGYRGLDSQRSEFTQVLKDGVSIKNEQFGFPETHYTPILDAVERIEFIRGGAALMYGPQPGGAINFVMKMPRGDQPFHFTTKNAFGSDELFTNFTAVDGTVGRFGYYGYYDHRERDGFRQNGDYEVNNGSARLVWDLTDDSRIILTYDGYEEEHGEPGGLRRPGDPGLDLIAGGQIVRFYDDDRNATTRLFDRFRLSRHYGMLEYQKAFSERTQLDIKAFGGYLSRWSKRQRGGGVGIQPDPAESGAAGTNDIQDRYAWSEGAEARLRHDYDFFGDVSTFAGGLYFYHALQLRDDRRGLTPDAEDAALRRSNYGETTNGSIFAENRFKFGRFSITPGMRLEFFGQSLDEEVNLPKTNPPPGTPARPLAHQSDFLFAPLFGIGTSYLLVEGEEILSQNSVAGGKGAEAKDGKSIATPTVLGRQPPRVEVYGNLSQAYRPPTYGELVPLAANGIINGDLEEGHSLQAEIGLRGKPFSYLTFEVSGFWYNFEEQIGEVEIPNPDFPANPPATLIETRNVGDAEYWGFEAAAELDVLALINREEESPWGRFNLYGNVTVLDAEFTGGLNEGNVPAYAPDYLFKTGVLYRWKERVKAGFIGTIVDEHFANAGNTYQFFVPGYQVWDLTAEVKFWEGRIGVFAGIKNLFDEDYWAEVREEGILPAYRRNYYAGVEFFW